MPVNVETKHALFDVFTRMEDALKRNVRYLQGAEGQRASANWQRFGSDIGPKTAGRISERAIESLTTLPPMQEIVRDGARAFDPQTAALRGGRRPETLGQRLIEASVRVRNTLFHGGKEDPALERYLGHDQHVVDAALEVLSEAERLMHRMNR
jgi:hypothetical protein